MATKKETKEVTLTKKEPMPKNALAVISKDFESELAEDSGRGFEEATRDAFAIPFLNILQDLSPQVKKKMAGYIEGARPGQFYQSVTQALHDAVRVIPCHFSQVFIEWVPRNNKAADNKSGFVAVYDAIEGSAKAKTAVREGGKFVLPNGNELQDTREHYVLQLLEDGSTQPALIALKSSGIKVSRRWMSQMQTAVLEIGGRVIPAPMFAWSYKLGSEEEANDQGSWYQWTVTDRERVTDIELYRRAKLFGASMAQGKVKVNYEEMAQAVDAERRPVSQGEVPGDLDNEM
jgi:hypothetical protein